MNVESTYKERVHCILYIENKSWDVILNNEPSPIIIELPPPVLEEPMLRMFSSCGLLPATVYSTEVHSRRRPPPKKIQNRVKLLTVKVRVQGDVRSLVVFHQSNHAPGQLTNGLNYFIFWIWFSELFKFFEISPRSDTPALGIQSLLGSKPRQVNLPGVEKLN